ncbi:RHS repeat protein, partial [Achromobacter sp. K91]|uniref:RHS repeat-associated core domain-containing protein n=1 Tax=Achromobacter sp. K91 TaxID=2292262 RepID=UPI000EC92DF6
MALLTVCTGTPTIRVRDNRGQAVRTLRYNRNVAGGVATQCIERNTFNDLGQPSSSQDARFFAQGGNSPTLNFQHTPALSGQVLQTVSADAGTTQTFHDIAGHPIWQRDARGTVQTFTYDAQGRPLTRSEQVEGKGPTYVRERWTYGDALPPGGSYDATDTTDPRNLNLRGQVVQHYDTAGLLDHGARGFTVQGPVQQEVRTLAQDPQAEIDWNAAGLATHWPGVLDPTPYPTSWQYNALGQVLAQTDAAGHQRNSTYDLAGRLFGSTVTLKGGSPQSVVRTQTYNAAGQLLVKQAGTGVTTTHTYEPQLTQRLLTIKTTRDSDRATLQSKQYTYDPVGNVTVLQDPLSQPQYFKGQAISPDKTYTYDALYQLIQATGRQNATGTPTDTGTPAGILSPPDPVNLQSYTRSYTYDLGGNLTGVNLNGAGANRKVVVAPNSNRALSNANIPTLNAGAVDTYFDAAGNAICLDGNSLQPLTWNGLNQLQSVTFVYRHDQNSDENDREYYIYGGDGQRVRKTRYAKVGAAYSQQQDDVIYLPGLELRRQGATKTLEVLVLDDGARLLHWTVGAPAGIANPQLRLAIQDRLGSCSMELDTAGQLITQEEYFPFGGTAVLAAATQSDVDNKTIRYSGKERDATGLYYYGFRYYQPWIGRWLNTDPAGTVDGLNLYGMVKNNPASLRDHAGLVGEDGNR